LLKGESIKTLAVNAEALTANVLGWLFALDFFANIFTIYNP
jgi:hypothetical protein